MSLETSSQDGLTVTFDEETSIFTFDWNEETHPEYNFLKDLTSDDFSQMMQEYLDSLEPTNNESSSCPS